MVSSKVKVAIMESIFIFDYTTRVTNLLGISSAIYNLMSLICIHGRTGTLFYF